jgi:hypothetical protein
MELPASEQPSAYETLYHTVAKGVIAIPGMVLIPGLKHDAMNGT